MELGVPSNANEIKQEWAMRMHALPETWPYSTVFVCLFFILVNGLIIGITRQYLERLFVPMIIYALYVAAFGWGKWRIQFDNSLGKTQLRMLTLCMGQYVLDMLLLSIVFFSSTLSLLDSLSSETLRFSIQISYLVVILIAIVLGVILRKQNPLRTLIYPHAQWSDKQVARSAFRHFAWILLAVAMLPIILQTFVPVSIWFGLYAAAMSFGFLMPSMTTLVDICLVIFDQ